MKYMEERDNVFLGIIVANPDPTCDSAPQFHSTYLIFFIFKYRGGVEMIIFFDPVNTDPILTG